MAVVLVVEDEMGIARLLEDVLTDEGHRVLLASNGQQGLALAKDDRPDVIITDYMMPVMDGAALMKALAVDPALADIPVVMISSMPEDAISERCTGYAKFVRKPFKIFGMIDIVAELTRAGR